MDNAACECSNSAHRDARVVRCILSVIPPVSARSHCTLCDCRTRTCCTAMGATHTHPRLVMHRTPHGGVRPRARVRDHASCNDHTPRNYHPTLARMGAPAHAGRARVVGVEGAVGRGAWVVYFCQRLLTQRCDKFCPLRSDLGVCIPNSVVD